MKTKILRAGCHTSHFSLDALVVGDFDLASGNVLNYATVKCVVMFFKIKVGKPTKVVMLVCN